MCTLYIILLYKYLNCNGFKFTQITILRNDISTKSDNIITDCTFKNLLKFEHSQSFSKNIKAPGCGSKDKILLRLC